MKAEELLARFPEQFKWQPGVVHNEVLRPHKYAIVCGMGGSHLGAWFLKRYGKASNIFIHRDYGLPALPQDINEQALVILSSYSGSTEEVLDAGSEALREGRQMAVATTGGKLLEFAREHALPHVVIPETGLEPRMAIGFSMLAIARLMQLSQLEREIVASGTAVDPSASNAEGHRIAETIHGKLPVIYSSAANVPLAYIWKIKFNETSKIPAFLNVFPEMCHNEINGFGVVDATRDISARLHAIFLDDFSDHPRVRQRMQIAADMMGERGIPAEHVALAGKTGFEKAFNAAILADWVAFELAESYGVPYPETPMVAEFKQRIGQ